MTPKSESSLLAQQTSSDNIDTGKGLFNGQINKSLVVSQEIFSKPYTVQFYKQSKLGKIILKVCEEFELPKSQKTTKL